MEAISAVHNFDLPRLYQFVGPPFSLPVLRFLYVYHPNNKLQQSFLEQFLGVQCRCLENLTTACREDVVDCVGKSVRDGKGLMLIHSYLRFAAVSDVQLKIVREMFVHDFRH